MFLLTWVTSEQFSRRHLKPVAFLVVLENNALDGRYNHIRTIKVMTLWMIYVSYVVKKGDFKETDDFIFRMNVVNYFMEW